MATGSLCTTTPSSFFIWYFLLVVVCLVDQRMSLRGFLMLHVFGWKHASSIWVFNTFKSVSNRITCTVRYQLWSNSHISTFPLSHFQLWCHPVATRGHSSHWIPPTSWNYLYKSHVFTHTGKAVVIIQLIVSAFSGWYKNTCAETSITHRRIWWIKNQEEKKHKRKEKHEHEINT